ncbi:MAG: hypothetical protein WC683_12985 [bacterium]
MAYAEWQDVKYWLDQAAVLNPGETFDVGPTDPKVLQTFEGLAEKEFENDVRGYVKVPIDRDVSPELYAQAKDICAMRAAALLLKSRNQVERDERTKWYDDYLESRADKIMAQMMKEAHKAPDAETPTNPVVTIPSFLGLPTVEAQATEQETW